MVIEGKTLPSDDATAIYNAFTTRFEFDETVVDILPHRDAAQRAQIQHQYQVMYSDDILNCLSSELSGKLGIAVLLWMHDPVKRDAIVVRQGLSSETKNLEAATEVICSRTPSQIQCFKQVYYSSFEAHLEDDIKTQASGDLKELLVAYVSTHRDEGLEFDKEIAVKDSEALLKAGEKKLGTDAILIHIFSKRSRVQLAAFHHMYGESLEKAVKKGKTSDLFKYAILTILRCSENPARYFAKVLHKAIKGWRTDDTTIMRVIVTRTEIDMQCIKAEYLDNYKKTLNDAVHSKTSGHYRTFLLSLLGPNC